MPKDFGGKAQQKGAGKGDGQKSQKGKTDQKVCQTCGKAGRMVSEENTNAKANAETGTVASSTTTTSQGTSWKSGTVKRVEAVSHFEFENEPIIFYLRPMSMSRINNKQIRMVQFSPFMKRMIPMRMTTRLPITSWS